MAKLKPRDVIRAAYLYCGKLLEEGAATWTSGDEQLDVTAEDSEWVHNCWRETILDISRKLTKKGTPRRKPKHDRQFRTDPS